MTTTPPTQGESLLAVEQEREAIALVREIETRPIEWPFSDEEAPPFWYVEVGDYSAYFEFEQAARNFAGAINDKALALTKRPSAPLTPAYTPGSTVAGVEVLQEALKVFMIACHFVEPDPEIERAYVLARAALGTGESEA